MFTIVLHLLLPVLLSKQFNLQWRGLQIDVFIILPARGQPQTVIKRNNKEALLKLGSPGNNCRL